MPETLQLSAAGTLICPCQSSLCPYCSALGDCSRYQSILRSPIAWCVAWYGAGFLTGAYGKDAQDGYVGPAALTAAKTWAIAAPLGLVFRSVLKGYAPPVAFVIVTMTVTGVLTIGWRSGLAALTKPFVRIHASLLLLLSRCSPKRWCSLLGPRVRGVCRQQLCCEACSLVVLLQ